MLRRLVIRDFAIVRQLELEFEGGFSVLTGETGAGKSILIDALKLCLGERAQDLFVREGAARCEVCAEFEINAAAREWMEEAGFECLDDTVLLRRVVERAGANQNQRQSGSGSGSSTGAGAEAVTLKSRGWINGGVATVTQMQALGERLVDIYGQHAYQSLTRPDAVRALFDLYAGAREAAQTVAQSWRVWRTARAALEEAQRNAASLTQQREQLQWTLEELRKLAPQKGEWDSLNTEHTRHAHASSLMEGCAQVSSLLEGDESGAHAQLQKAIHVLDDLARHDATLNDWLNTLTQAQTLVLDAAREVNAYLQDTEQDPARLQELDERLSAWHQLARKHRVLPELLADKLLELEQQWQRLEEGADIEALQAREASANAELTKHAERLSKQRRAAAPKLSSQITQTIRQLGMPKGQVQVQLEPQAQVTQYGLEDVLLLVAGHAGASPKPLAKVASGGELARIALAIAQATSAQSSATTLIFDEIDVGVGGAVADSIGRLLRSLGTSAQVFCVTHLPQVAACGHHHLQVSKTTQADQTTTTVQPLLQEARTQELARMLGGQQSTQTSLDHARALLREAGQVG